MNDIRIEDLLNRIIRLEQRVLMLSGKTDSIEDAMLAYIRSSKTNGRKAGDIAAKFSRLDSPTRGNILFKMELAKLVVSTEHRGKRGPVGTTYFTPEYAPRKV